MILHMSSYVLKTMNIWFQVFRASLVSSEPRKFLISIKELAKGVAEQTDPAVRVAMCQARKGTNGVSTDVVTANLDMFFDRGTVLSFLFNNIILLLY